MSRKTEHTVPIYLDYNATTPIDPAVANEMLPFLTDPLLHGNPSSSHYYGVRTKQAVEKARARVANMLSCHPDEVVFSSGGTESNNYAIRGVLDRFHRERKERGDGRSSSSSGGDGRRRVHVVTSSVEHPSVMEVCQYVASRTADHGGHGVAVDVTMVGVDQYGTVDMEELERVLRERRDDTVLVTIMHANNETGTVQPIGRIARLAKEINNGIIVHTDAAQSVGKVPVNVQELGVDLLTVCSHKLYGPKGIGALFVRRGVQLDKQLHGANHEMNMRPGTENVLEVVGLGKACELVHEHLEPRAKHMLQLRDRLHCGLLRELDPQYDDDDSASDSFLTTPSRYVHLNGHPTDRLPNTLYVSFPHVEANTLLSAIEDRIAASAGAACHSGDDVHVSQTLQAMKVPMDVAMGTIRFSTGMMLTEKDVDEAVDIISSAVKRLRPELEDSTDAESGVTGDSYFADGDDIVCKLTTMTKGLGCGCKLRPQELSRVLEMLPVQTANPNVLVGFDTNDDASVYKLTEDLAMVTTCDFFTPICDDPYQFGQIACANAMSDVWAMGARPIQALNLMMFPIRRLPQSVMLRILQGAQDKCQEAGVSILGGHTIEDNEPKFGQSVTGLVNPKEIWYNRGARVGDVLVLTKPIGTGILTTAYKRKLVDEETIERAITIMSTLNMYAFDSIKRSGVTVHACTDITGFGLLGHLKEMCQPLAAKDGVATHVKIYASKVPLIDSEKLHQLANMTGVVPGGTINNHAYTSDSVHYENSIPMGTRLILNDAQTSGGLLVAISRDELDQLRDECVRSNVDLHYIGEVVEPSPQDSKFIKVLEETC